MLIRKMVLMDLEEVLKMEQKSYKNPWTKKHYLYELLENELAFNYVLVLKEEVIGYYLFTLLFEEINLTKLTIKEKYQRKGLASFLLKDCFSKAKELNCNKVFLEVRESNKKAINLYYKNGFKNVHTREKYYQDLEDALILERLI